MLPLPTMAGTAPTALTSFDDMDLPPPEVAIIVARFHPEITEKLLEGAMAAYKARNGSTKGVRVFHVPGAFEIAGLISFLMSQQSFAAYVALGCIVKGETSHDQVLGAAVTQTLSSLSLEVPIGLGVLTVNTIEQAKERAGGSQGNKGADAMQAALSITETMDGLLIEADEREVELMSRSVAHAPSGRSASKNATRKKESR
jgi:6,7-dimethyl-8-ribityllumazine synthase